MPQNLWNDFMGNCASCVWYRGSFPCLAMEKTHPLHKETDSWAMTHLTEDAVPATRHCPSMERNTQDGRDL